MRSTGKHGSWWESPSGKLGIKALPAQGAGGAWRREPDWGLGLFVRGKPRQNVLFVHDITRVRIVVLRGVNGCSGAPVRIRFLRYGEAADQGREALFHQFKDGDGFRNQIHGKNAALPGFFHVPDQAVHGIKLVAFQQGYVQFFRPFRNCRQLLPFR